MPEEKKTGILKYFFEDPRARGHLITLYFYEEKEEEKKKQTKRIFFFFFVVQTTTPTFWAGTNNGTVYAFTINMPPAAKRRETAVVSQLGKEIQLKHRAPVLSIHVVDNKGCPVRRETPPPHRVLIISEEQIKVRYIIFIILFH